MAESTAAHWILHSHLHDRRSALFAEQFVCFPLKKDVCLCDAVKNTGFLIKRQLIWILYVKCKIKGFVHIFDINWG